MAPRVSIGIPVFNGARYLRGAVESLLAQDFGDFELLISDNASSDGTEVIGREMASADPRVRYVRQPENRGAAWNHNVLVHEARGSYFRWHSHDDLCSPSYLSACVDVLDRSPDVVLCYPGTLLIDAAGAPIGVFDDGLGLGEASPSGRLAHLVDRLVLCNAALGLIRLNVLRTTRLLGTYPSADLVLLAELALRGTFHEAGGVHFLRRIHPAKSTVAHAGARQRAIWFDPANARRLVIFRRTRLLLEHLEAVRLAPIRFAERGRAWGIVAHRFARRFAGEGLLALRLRRPRALIAERTRPAEPAELEPIRHLLGQ